MKFTSGIRVRDPVTRITKLLKMSPGFQLNRIEHAAGNNVEQRRLSRRIQPRAPGLAIMATLNLRRRDLPPRLVIVAGDASRRGFTGNNGEVIPVACDTTTLFSTSPKSAGWIRDCCLRVARVAPILALSERANSVFGDSQEEAQFKKEKKNSPPRRGIR